MPEHAAAEMIQTNVLEHPAVRAWNELLPERIEPENIEILEEHKKSAIYRLEGVGMEGASVIAKRCRTAAALIERAIYEEVLPHLPISVPHYYGFTKEDDNFCWLFLEDAGGEKYSPYHEEHRVLAAQWLGLLHTSAAHVAVAKHLPDRGSSHYLDHLQSGRVIILRNLANPELQADDLALLQSIVSQCETLESGWHKVEELCAGLPQTLVHCDFTGKNLRIRAGKAGKALLSFDWEVSGWGVPTTDLAQSALRGTGGFSANPDIATYWLAVRDHWPSLDLQTIQRLANCGKMFRCLAAINWKARSLAYPGTEWVMEEMRIYQAELSDAIQAATWAQ